MIMAAKVIYRTARSAVLEIADGGKYHTLQPYELWVNGVYFSTTDTVITNLFGLKPQTGYRLQIRPAGGSSPAGEDGADSVTLSFETEYESATINVRDFGAKGDGESDDTLFLQTAVELCPKDGRVLVPEGVYKFRTLFLRSGLTMCLEKGAVLSAYTQEDKLPLLPGVVQCWDEKHEINPGTWEGNPLPCHTGIVAGYGVSNVLLYGEGRIDGCAGPQNWWRKDRVKKLPARPRLFFLNRCSHVTVQGLTFCNSPSWTIHPYFSDHLDFFGTRVENPEISPNTDGLDPESSRGIRIYGMRFSLGDDCIAIKSGKIYMGMRYGTPSSNIQIRHCLLEKGHGAVTIGSEMAGGVNNVLVEDCVFSHTDRGLRIKTRRGRGENAVVDLVTFRNIGMDHVGAPVVVNCFYYCDPDGHSSFVQDRSPRPVDESTPWIRRLDFENLDCRDCRWQAVWVEGLPERKVERVSLVNCRFDFSPEADEGIPAMTEGVRPISRGPIHASNVAELILRQVSVEGQENEVFQY